MQSSLVLASGSAIRAQLLRQAGLEVEIAPPRIDEGALRAALMQEAASPRDVADALAEQKAAKVSRRFPSRHVLGCDQVLVHDGQILAKPDSIDVAREQLLRLRDQTHHLLSAAVLYQDGQPVWRHVDRATLTMRAFSDGFLEGYLARGWPGLGDSVGGYKLEEEGVRLFSRIEGSHFTILGLPLLPLLVHLGRIGAIDA